MRTIGVFVGLFNQMMGRAPKGRCCHWVQVGHLCRSGFTVCYGPFETINKLIPTPDAIPRLK